MKGVELAVYLVVGLVYGTFLGCLDIWPRRIGFGLRIALVVLGVAAWLALTWFMARRWL